MKSRNGERAADLDGALVPVSSALHRSPPPANGSAPTNFRQSETSPFTPPLGELFFSQSLPHWGLRRCGTGLLLVPGTCDTSRTPTSPGFRRGCFSRLTQRLLGGVSRVDHWIRLWLLGVLFYCSLTSLTSFQAQISLKSDRRFEIGIQSAARRSGCTTSPAVLRLTVLGRHGFLGLTLLASERAESKAAELVRGRIPYLCSSSGYFPTV